MPAEDPTVRGGAAAHRRRRRALGEHVAEVERVGRPSSTARHLDAADRLAERHAVHVRGRGEGGRACACVCVRRAPAGGPRRQRDTGAEEERLEQQRGRRQRGRRQRGGQQRHHQLVSAGPHERAPRGATAPAANAAARFLHGSRRAGAATPVGELLEWRHTKPLLCVHEPGNRGCGHKLLRRADKPLGQRTHGVDRALEANKCLAVGQCLKVPLRAVDVSSHSTLADGQLIVHDRLAPALIHTFGRVFGVLAQDEKLAVGDWPSAQTRELGRLGTGQGRVVGIRGRARGRGAAHGS
eukprot:scaffold74554_cov63-Phaeocystis_antarctica.AAC.2